MIALRVLLLSLLLPLLLLACKTVRLQPSLHLGLAVPKSYLWPEAKAEVCFRNQGYQREKAFIKQTIQREINAKTAFSFHSFKDCEKKMVNRVEIEFKKNTIPRVTVGFPNGADAVYHMLAFTFPQKDFAPCRACVSSDDCMQKICMHNTVLHEFSHILGLLHEQDRPDSECHKDTGALLPNARIIGKYDHDSIMNACNPDYFKKILALSQDDVATINKLYRKPQSDLPPFQDDDGDTVHNDDDLCPNTPPHSSVWLIGSCRGCSPLQHPPAVTNDADSDDDGVPDTDDKCPNTQRCAHVWEVGTLKGCTGGDVL